MNLKKCLSMIMVLSMTAAVFTGCGSSSDSTSDDSAVAGKKGTENNTGEEDSSEGDKEKLTFWDFHTGTEADVIQDMVNAYNQSQDKVKVEYSSVNQTDYTTTLVTTAYANGECPDILWVEPATFKKFSDAEMLADLSSYYTDDLKKIFFRRFLKRQAEMTEKSIHCHLSVKPLDCFMMQMHLKKKVLNHRKHGKN